MPVQEKPWMCSMCGYRMDAYSPAVGPADTIVANEGDASICLNCGTEYVRAGGLWRLMTKADRAALDPEARYTLNRAALVRPAFNRVIGDLAAGRGGRA
jgi:hypothetical protein